MREVIAPAATRTIADPSPLLARYIPRSNGSGKKSIAGSREHHVADRARVGGHGTRVSGCGGGPSAGRRPGAVARAAARSPRAGISLVRLDQPPPPALTAPVNDFANVIDRRASASSTGASARCRQATGDVVVVATVPTFQPSADINEYAVKMFENGGRGIGEKGKDNGALIVLAVKERQVRVEVGYDLEEFITDGFAGETIREVMTPQFRNGDYGARAARRRDADHQPHRRAPRRRAAGRAARAPADQAPRGFGSWKLILLVWIIIMILSSRGRRRRRGGRWGGGPWSGWNSGVGPVRRRVRRRLRRRIRRVRWRRRWRRRLRRIRRRPQRRRRRGGGW